MRYRYANDGLEKEVSDENALVCPEPTLAQQQFKDDTDPNVIMEKFARTGDLSLLTKGQTPQYVDLIGQPTDYQQALNTVLQGQEAFNELPARARERFGNDPAVFLEFIS